MDLISAMDSDNVVVIGASVVLLSLTLHERISTWLRSLTYGRETASDRESLLSEVHEPNTRGILIEEWRNRDFAYQMRIPVRTTHERHQVEDLIGRAGSGCIADIRWAHVYLKKRDFAVDEGFERHCRRARLMSGCLAVVACILTAGLGLIAAANSSAGDPAAIPEAISWIGWDDVLLAFSVTVTSWVGSTRYESAADVARTVSERAHAPSDPAADRA